jgi:hypothetical protein
MARLESHRYPSFSSPFLFSLSRTLRVSLGVFYRSNRSLLKYMNTTQKTSRLEFDALLIPIANKSAARALESLLISALKAQNYEVCGDKDACHTRFSLNPSS